MNIGSTISSLRKSKNISQVDFAEGCHISQAYLSLIEGNKKEPTLATLKDIANYLKVPIPVLFFMALEEKDVPEDKHAFFNTMKPTLSGFFESIFANDTESHNK